MSELRKQIFEILKENRNGITRQQLLVALKTKSGKDYPRTTVYDNLPHKIIRKVSIHHERGRPYTKFKLIQDFERFINEDYP